MTMSRIEFDTHVWPVFQQLWPRHAAKSTPEQIGGWIRACIHTTPERAIEALRDVFDGGEQWPNPAMLRAKLTVNSTGQEARVTQASIRAQEEHERFAADVRRVIDATSDDDLAAHAIMHAASHPNLLWTVHESPRESLGMRCVLWARISAGLQPNDATGLRKGNGGVYGMFTIPQADIDRAIAEKAKPSPKGKFLISVGNVADNRKAGR
jgi:hypothetical protein